MRFIESESVTFADTEILCTFMQFYNVLQKRAAAPRRLFKKTYRYRRGGGGAVVVAAVPPWTSLVSSLNRTYSIGQEKIVFKFKFFLINMFLKCAKTTRVVLSLITLSFFLVQHQEVF